MNQKMKSSLRKKGFQLFRALLDKKIIEIIPQHERIDNPVRVQMHLQEDFSLTQDLSLFLSDSLRFVDPFSDDYALQVLSLWSQLLKILQ